MLSDVIVSTAVCVGNMFTKIDLDVTYDHMAIDCVILGIKYGKLIKGDIKKTNSFFNQISFVVNINSKTSNVKMFSNGTFQISGIKTEEQAKDAVKEIVKRMQEIKGEYSIEVDNSFAGLVSKDNCVFGKFKENVYKKIGKIENKIVSFGNVRTEVYKENEFITKTYTDRKKIIYDKNAKVIGVVNTIFDRPKKNFTIKNIHVKEGILYNKWNTRQGFEMIEYTSEADSSQNPKQIKVSYSCLDENFDTEKEILFRICNINCNTSLNLSNSYMDRLKFVEMAEKDDLWVDFVPEVYPGCKLRIYLIDGKIQKCCHTTSGKKCKLCVSVSIIVFQSGKLLISGINSLENANVIKEFMNDFFKKNCEYLIKNNVDPKLNKVSKNALTIYDLL